MRAEMKVEIRTEIVDDKIIMQDFYSDFDGIIRHVSRGIMDASEKEIRKALVKLGWTPPKDGKKSR